MPDLEQIARALAAAYNRCPEEGQAMMSGLLAEVVDARHVPALRSDGPWRVADVARVAGFEHLAWRKAAHDFRTEATAEVRGDSVLLDHAYLGTLASGEPVRVPILLELVFKDGEVIEMVATVARESHVFLWELMQAAGVTKEDLALQTPADRPGDQA